MGKTIKTIIKLPRLELRENETINEAWERSEKPVRNAFEQIVRDIDKNNRWNDPDFGPSYKDKYGKYSFYRNGRFNPPLVDPEVCNWSRPTYNLESINRNVGVKQDQHFFQQNTIDLSCSNDSIMSSQTRNNYVNDQRFNASSEVYSKTDVSDDLTSDSSFWHENNNKDGEEAELDVFFGRQKSIGADKDPDSFSKEGRLFLDDAESGDCIQGKVGNCWFIGGLSVLATRDDLLRKCFWQCENNNYLRKFMKYGVWVLKFFKNNEWCYVFIDDKFPTFKSNNKLVFGHCKDENELWVPIIEKAYAKLHGSYDSLTGGFIDTALRELSGLPTERVILDSNMQGYDPQHKMVGNSKKLWKKLHKYVNDWGCLIGSSIVPSSTDSGSSNSYEVSIKDTGLMGRHAYAIIDVGEIKFRDPNGEKKVIKLVRMRNPWGFGEWKGRWSDDSTEFTENFEALSKEFGTDLRKQKPSSERRNNGRKRFSILKSKPLEVEKLRQDSSDGTFFISFEDWLKYFSVLFLSYEFPKNYSKQKGNQFLSGETNGGYFPKSTIAMNPVIRFQVNAKRQEKDSTVVFLCQGDKREEFGRDQNRHQNPIALHVFKEKDWEKYRTNVKKLTLKCVNSTPYQMHLSTTLHLKLENGKYVILPTCYDRKVQISFFMCIYSRLEARQIPVEFFNPVVEEENLLETYLNISVCDTVNVNHQDEQFCTVSPEIIAVEEFKENIIGELLDQKRNLKYFAKDFQDFCEDKNGLSFKKFNVFLKKNKLPLVKQKVFNHLGGKDEVIDEKEFLNFIAHEKKFQNILGTSNVSKQDQQLVPLKSDCKCECANSLASLKKQQGNMMHLLLLFGKMLDCYDGPMKSPLELIKGQLDTYSKASYLGDETHDRVFRNDEFLAVQPWKFQVIPKTFKIQHSNWSFDGNSVKAEHVYGINNYFACNFGVVNSNLCYSTASTNISVNVDSNSMQRFNFEHHDDISSLDTCHELGVVATGQTGKHPVICIWKAESASLVKIFGKKKLKGVAFKQKFGISHLKFSSSGKTLVAIGLDDHHSISVFKTKSVWSEGKFIASMKGNRKRICFLQMLGKKSFLIGGEESLFAFRPFNNINESQSRKFKPRSLRLPKLKNTRKLFALSATKSLSVESNDKNVSLVSLSSGHILVLQDDNTEEKFGELFEKGVYCTAIRGFNKKQDCIVFLGLSNGNIQSYYIGKKQGTEKFYFHCLNTFKRTDSTSKILGIEVDLASKSLYFSSKEADVYRLPFNYYKAKVEFKEENSEKIISGHFKEEVWGLHVHDNERILTGGDDGTVRLICFETKKELFRLKLPNRCRSITSSKKYNLVVCGLGGRFGGKKYTKKDTKEELGLQFLSIKGNQLKLKKRIHFKGAVSVVKFSPSESLLVVATHKSKIKIFSVKDLSPIKVFCRNSSTVTHIDFSIDDKYIRTNDMSYEILYFRRSNKGFKQETKKSNLSEVALSSHDCPFSWETKGIWEDFTDGTDVNAVAVSPNKSILAVATDLGEVRIYPFPCLKKEKFLKLKGHSSHVTNVKFSQCGTFLFSTGGHDRSVFQWRVKL